VLVLLLAVIAALFLFDYLCEVVDPLAGLGLLALIVGPVLVFEIAKI